MNNEQRNHLGIVGIVGEASYCGYGLSIIEEAVMIYGAKAIRWYESFKEAEEALECEQIAELFVMPGLSLNIFIEHVIKSHRIEVPLFCTITEKGGTFPGDARLDENICLNTDNGQPILTTNSQTIEKYGQKYGLEIMGTKVPGAIVDFIILKKK